MLSTVRTAAPAAGPKNAPVPPITAAISTVAERAIDTLSGVAISTSISVSVPATPAKNDAHRDTLAGELSYAEQRALDLGIALASGARTLLLDEPTAGMSRAQAARMIALIRATTQGRTVLLIEHDMDAVFGFAERITVLVRGTVVATGAPDAIRTDPAVRAAYLGEGGP